MRTVMAKRRYPEQIILLAGVILLLASTAYGYYVDPAKIGSPKGEVCIQCHKEATPGIYNQWRESAMGQAGVNCYDCHRAEKGDPDAFEHKELISIVVSPKDCSRCHEKEYKEFEASQHSSAVAILKDPDVFAGEAAWGAEHNWEGCRPCHGSVLKVEEGGKLSQETWPNTGIGRINPDKSRGACTACHTRHLFSKGQARRPDTCGRCHTGDAHPQKEVYAGSKHGIMYAAYGDEMNLDKQRWLAGQAYYQGPTCVSCHMGAMPPQMDVKNADERIDQALRSVLKGDERKFEALLSPTRVTKRYYGTTHNVSSRLSWNLKSPVSTKRKDWQLKRQMMQAVCKQCHGDHFVAQQYMQFDQRVEEFNEKYARPATNMRKALMKDDKISADPYDDPLDVIYWKLVDKDGRRAKNGAAMINPEVAWNSGMQAAAERFYGEFVPEIRKLLGRRADKFLRKYGDQKAKH